MTNTEQRIEAAAKIMGKAMAKLDKVDPELAKRVSDLLSKEMQAIREGRQVAGRKKRGPGRPPLGRTTVRINFKMSEADRKLWQAAADREGLSLSEWLRAAAELAVARGSTR